PNDVSPCGLVVQDRISVNNVGSAFLAPFVRIGFVAAVSVDSNTAVSFIGTFYRVHIHRDYLEECDTVFFRYEATALAVSDRRSVTTFREIKQIFGSSAVAPNVGISSCSAGNRQINLTKQVGSSWSYGCYIGKWCW